jgi:hypothetical protein
MTGALARIEARHLARSPLLLMGMALGVAAGALELSWYLPALAGDDLIAYRNIGLLLSGGAVLAGAWLALRDRTTGAADLLVVTPIAPWRLWTARLASVAVAAAGVFAALFAATLAVSAVRGGRGLPDLRLLGDGALGVVLGGWVGLTVGRLTGSRMVSVLAAPVWVGLYLFVGQDTRLALSVQNLSPVLGLYNRSAAYGFLPDPLWPHLGYLLGLTLLVGTLVLAVAFRGGGRRTPPRPLLAAAAAGLLLAGASGARLLALPDGLVVLGPDRGSWQPVEDDPNPLASWAPPSPSWSFPPDGRARTCAGDAAMTVCVYPAYGQRLAREIHAAVAPVAGPLAGLPGVPTRIRMVPVGGGSCRGAEVQISEMRVREPSTVSDEQVRSNYVADYLHCAVGPLLGEQGPVGEAGEAVAQWALLISGAMTREQLQELGRGNYPGGPSPGTVEAALAMAALPTDQVRAELAPVWKRLRAGTLPLSELPGARP